MIFGFWLNHSELQHPTSSTLRIPHRQMTVNMPNPRFVIFRVPLIMVTWFSMSLNYTLISFLSIIIYGGRRAFQDR